MKVLGPILTFLFAWIDSIVAKMITLVYNLLMNLSNLVLYSDSIVKTLGQRIGIILGIFMLFRLAVSLINYMISPEKFSDNKTGGTQLVKNIIISLVLLATINTIFETAYMVQKRIVESGIVQKIFFGDNSNTDSVDIGYYLYTGLFTPNEDVIPECKTMWDITEPISQECDDKLFELTETNARNSIYEARNDLDMSKVFSNYDVVTANRDGAFTGTELFNYTPIVSTAVGVMALLILVSFSMELAIRAVKLLFLQIVAPVPIIANMDTGKGKDIFNKWLKQCINTYISVFIRLIAINFGVFMIVLVKGNFKDIFTGNILLNIFVIIGCLMFAKQVPKLIEDMFGIKLDGMSLRPLKKFQENALFGKQITSLGAAGLAGGAAFASNFAANIYNNQDRKGLLGAAGTLVTAFGSGIGGAASATARGTVGAIKGQKFGQTYKGAYGGAITARNNRIDRNDLDISGLDIMGNRITHSFGVSTVAEKQDSEIKIAQEFSKSSETNASLSESEVDKNAQKISLARFNGGSAVTVGGSTYSTLAELREGAHDQSKTAAERAAIDDAYQKMRGDIAKKLRERAAAGNVTATGSEFAGITTFDNSALETMKTNTENMLDIYKKNKNKQVFAYTSETDIQTGVKVHKKVNEISNKIQNSAAYREAHKIQQQAQKEKK